MSLVRSKRDIGEKSNQERDVFDHVRGCFLVLFVVGRIFFSFLFFEGTTVSFVDGLQA